MFQAQVRERAKKEVGRLPVSKSAGFPKDKEITKINIKSTRVVCFRRDEPHKDNVNGCKAKEVICDTCGKALHCPKIANPQF